MLALLNLMDMKLMCLRKLLILVINAVIIGCLSRQRHNDGWEQISFRYGTWRKLPQYEKAAFEEGYTRFNDVCRTDFFHGFRFMKDNNTKTMPIYDLNGELMGIQTMIPGNMKGFNSQNQTIDLPPVEIMPPVLKGQTDSYGIQQYTVTAYFKHPSLLCNPFLQDGVLAGKGLYIQMGNNPVHHHLYIPLKSEDLDALWMKGHCVPLMGTHYFKGLSPSLPCEKLNPLFLTYDMEGNLGAFGWVFQGRPNIFHTEEIFRLNPVTYPFLFNTSMLPPCMFHDQFQVFGVHIYLQDQKKLLCTKVDDLKPKNQNQRMPEVTKILKGDLYEDENHSKNNVDGSKVRINKDIVSNSNTVERKEENNVKIFNVGSASKCNLGLIILCIMCTIYQEFYVQSR